MKEGGTALGVPLEAGGHVTSAPTVRRISSEITPSMRSSGNPEDANHLYTHLEVRWRYFLAVAITKWQTLLLRPIHTHAESCAGLTLTANANVRPQQE